MKALLLLTLAISSTAYAEPLAEFEKLVKGCQAIFDARPVEEVAFVQANKLWVKRVWSPIKMTYDVRKTDSLVSPFVGHIEVMDTVAVENAATEELARVIDLPADGKGTRGVSRISYAFQGGAWVITGGTTRTSFRRVRGGPYDSPFGSFEVAREEVPRSVGYLSRCAAL